MSVDNQFNRINEKLQLLLRQQLRLKRENERLRQELEVWQQKELDYRKKQQELEQRLAVLKMASGDMNDRDKKDFEKKINQYLRDIDKCIAFLSS